MQDSSVLMKKELENNKKVTFRIKFIDSVRFIGSLLTSLADNLTEKINNSKYKDCKSCLEYVENKDKLFIFKF